MGASDARPVPRKGSAYRLYFEFRKSDGSLVTGWTGADTELSCDGGSFVDATHEATEIGSSGVGYLDLTASEMNYDAVIVKSTITNTGAIPVVITLFPEEVGDIRADAVAISGDSAAADNLEAACDGGSYNLGGGAIVAASVTGNVGGNVAGSVGSVANYGTLVSDIVSGVWGATTRTLTSFGTLAQDVANAVWSATTRTLTSFGTLVEDVAAAVWNASRRTLTGFGSLVSDIWSAATRTITGVTSAGRTEIATDVDTVLTAAHGSGSWQTASGGGTDVNVVSIDGVPVSAAADSVTFPEVVASEQTLQTIADMPAWDALVQAEGATLTIRRGDTCIRAISGLGSITGRSKMWFTVKSRTTDDDDEAIIMIEETEGLTRLNGSPYTTTSDGSIMPGLESGIVVLKLEPVVTAQLRPGSYRYDLQFLVAGVIVTKAEGTFVVQADVTRATS